MGAVPKQPDPGETARAVAAAERFGIEEQARKMLDVYTSLRAANMEPVGG
jgi:hypothetical protein